MGAPADISPTGDKTPFFWIYQFVGEDMHIALVAETAKKNTVPLALQRWFSL